MSSTPDTQLGKTKKGTHRARPPRKGEGRPRVSWPPAESSSIRVVSDGVVEDRTIWFDEKRLVWTVTTARYPAKVQTLAHLREVDNPGIRRHRTHTDPFQALMDYYKGIPFVRPEVSRIAEQFHDAVRKFTKELVRCNKDRIDTTTTSFQP
jgi:hypothetical protein